MMRKARCIVYCQAIWGVMCLFGLSACQLPENDFSHLDNATVSTQSTHIPPTMPAPAQQGLSQFYPLNEPFASIAARIFLLRHAKTSLDLQYYIWNNDPIGRYLLLELLHAAERGVKVRLMLDDQNGNQLDLALWQLAQHPNIQISFFNPYQFRQARWLDVLTRSLAVNHRMHNKLIVADGQLAITGGRNISAEYYDAGPHFQFTDLDVLFYGSSAVQAQQVFQQFWQHRLNYDIRQWLGTYARATAPDALQQLKQQLERESQVLLHEQHEIATALARVQHAFFDTHKDWVAATFYADPPEKAEGLGQIPQDQLLIDRLLTHIGQPKQHLELVSAYFVPGEKGLGYLLALRQANIPVRILTNSLAANDVALVHAYYAPYRHTLLKHGVKLYEFKPYLHRERTWYERVSGNVIAAKGRNRSSLHAKFFDIDGQVFIGSFNFDPRSAYLNTEVGLAIPSDRLQNQITAALDQYLPQVAYELALDAQERIIWREYLPNGEVIIHRHDPHTTRFQRGVLWLAALFPFEWMM